MLKDLLVRAISRRGLFRLGGLSSLPMLATLLPARLARAAGGDAPEDDCWYRQRERESWWRDGGAYFVQPTVDTRGAADGLLRARLDGRWQDLRLRELNEDFVDWNFSKRATMLDAMMTGQLDMYNDIHNAAVASYGARRGDSRFSLNVAYKGTGWVPKPEYIDAMTEEYWMFKDADMGNKLSIIRNNYRDRDRWRTDIIGSLELYTSQQFETHTFRNQMANPISVICFHDMISYEVRCVSQLLHPNDPNLTEEERQIHRWVNYAHDFFHGGGQIFDDRIGVIYWVVEQFDNSPMGQTNTAGGYRVVPPM